MPAEGLRRYDGRSRGGWDVRNFSPLARRLRQEWGRMEREEKLRERSIWFCEYNRERREFERGRKRVESQFERTRAQLLLDKFEGWVRWDEFGCIWWD